MYLNLSKEQQLVLLCSRVTFDDKVIEQLGEFKQAELDWYTILEYCIKNKTVALVWNNVKKYKINTNVPNPVYDIFEYYLYLTGLRNKELMNAAKEVQEACLNAGVKIVPLKGLILINDVYCDPAVRHMNDLDFMIDFDDRMKVKEPLTACGFVQGRPNRADNVIKPYSRQEQISWGIAMNNMPLFIKQTDKTYVDFIEIDFTFSLDFERKTEVVADMVRKAQFRNDISMMCLQSVDMFIHLCTHLFKEATNATWIIYHQDINLIKFCDVREYYLYNYSLEWVDCLSKRVKATGGEKAVFYSLYYCHEIYGDSVILEYVNNMDIEDKAFLEQFGAREFGEVKKWKKSFFERLFTRTNRDEIKDEKDIVLI